MKKQVLTLLMASLISGTAFAAPGTVTEKTHVWKLLYMVLYKMVP